MREAVAGYLLAFVWISGHVSALEWDALQLTYPNYTDVKLTLTDLLASSGNYSLMTRDQDMNIHFYIYKNDPRFAIGYDSHGNIAGLRLSYLISYLDKKSKANNVSFPIKYYDKPMYKRGSFMGNEVFYTDILFLHPEKLKAGGRTVTNGVSVEDLYIRLKGKWSRVPKEESVQLDGFIKEGCYDGMGMHYWNFPNLEECLTLEGYFGLYDHGKLIGLGVAAFGGTVDRGWHDTAPASLFEEVAPLHPPCMDDWIDQHGILAIHIYFTSSAKSITCPKNKFNNIN